MPSNLLSSFCQFCLFFLCSLTTTPRSWLSFYASCFLSPDSLRVLQWNAGSLRVRSTELLHFLLSHPVDLICIKKSNLNSSSSFRIPGFSTLRSDYNRSRSGIISHDDTHAIGSVITSVRQGLSFYKISTSSLSLLDPDTDYVGVNISLNNSSSLYFLNAYASPIHSSPMDGKTDSFSPSILLSSRNLIILGDFNCHHPFETQKISPTPIGKKSSIGSSPPTSSPSTTMAYLLFSIAPQAVTPPLTSLLLPPLSPFLAHGRCFRTRVLITYQFFYLSLYLWPIAPKTVTLSSTFRKLTGMIFLLILIRTVLLQRNTGLFLFLLLLLSSFLWH